MKIAAPYPEQGLNKEPAKIVFEDEFLIALNKSANVHSADLPSSASKELTVAGYLARNFSMTRKASLKPEDSGLVNRLDFETSGLILAAKNRKVWLSLREQFNDGQVTKIYLAVLQGCPKELGLVSCFLGSSSRSAKKVKAFKRKPGTRYRAVRVEAKFSLLKTDPQNRYSLVEVDLKTGARHQIRAQAAFLGAPLVGDLLYGAKTTTADLFGCNSKEPSFLLHSYKLSLSHPITGKKLFFVVPAQGVLKRLLALE